MTINVFQPQGVTSMVALTTAASAAIQPSAAGVQGYKVCNLSTNDAYVATSISSGIAAAYPTTSTPALGMPVLQRSVETFWAPPNFWLSALTSSGTALLAVTPGVGQ